jgi:hypothetical protein
MLIKSNFKKSVYLLATLILLAGVTAILSATANAVPNSSKWWDDRKGWTFGPIASIQNNEEGEPSWILSGHWATNIINKTEDSFNQTSPAKFDASINMVMLDGSAKHNHKITNFSLSEITNEGNTTIYKGTVDGSMKAGPVKDIPVEIKVTGNNAIAISLDAEKTENHFGNTPIYGAIVTKADIAAFMSQMGNKTEGMMGEKGNMSMISWQ